MSNPLRNSVNALKGPNSIAGGNAPGGGAVRHDPEGVAFNVKCDPFRVEGCAVLPGALPPATKLRPFGAAAGCIKHLTGKQRAGVMGLLVWALLLSAVAPAWAQQFDPFDDSLLLLAAPAAWTQPAQSDPLAEHLFPPELIMEHQAALGLSDEQKQFFKTEARKTQTQLTEMQWKLQDEMEKIAALVKPDQVDEGAVTAQLNKVLSLEHEIKCAQLLFLVRLKNKLTPEQQTRLRALKAKAQAK